MYPGAQGENSILTFDSPLKQQREEAATAADISNTPESLRGIASISSPLRISLSQPLLSQPLLSQQYCGNQLSLPWLGSQSSQIHLGQSENADYGMGGMANATNAHGGVIFGVSNDNAAVILDPLFNSAP